MEYSEFRWILSPSKVYQLFFHDISNSEVDFISIHKNPNRKGKDAKDHYNYVQND